MRLEPKQVEAITRERRAIRDEIEKKFGVGAIAKAYPSLCGICRDEEECALCPITTEGKDCPYWTRKEGAKKCKTKKTS